MLNKLKRQCKSDAEPSKAERSYAERSKELFSRLKSIKTAVNLSKLS